METVTLGEAITRSFYAWEVRGRGWTTSPYPCALEPPYRPFFLLPGLVPTGVVIDDGKRPTILSRLADGVRSAFAPVAVSSEHIQFEEMEPFEGDDAGEQVTLRLHIPRDHDAKPSLSTELLAALATARYPVALEIVGSAGLVSMQITCATLDAPLVEGHLRGYLPGVTPLQGDDLLDRLGTSDLDTRVVEFGLTHEFFLPIRSLDSFAVDPYVALVAALERTQVGERLAVQIMFTSTRNPWARAIHDALDDGDGGCLIEDAPWFLKSATEKTESPLFAATVRLIGESVSTHRVQALIRGTAAFFTQYRDAHGNELSALEPEGDLLRAVSLRETYRTGMLLSARELAALVHVPGASVASTALVRSAVNTRELPYVARGHALVLGVNNDRGVSTDATIDDESRFAHTWVIGGSGTGKSTLLAKLILQDIEAGHGVAVLDPHGDLVDDVLARLPRARFDDVVLFDPADTDHPIGFNILKAESELERTLLASDLTAIMRRFATSWGDSMTTVLSEAVSALLAHPDGGTLVDVKRFIVDARFRAQVLARISDPDIRYFWETEYPVIGQRSVGPLVTRLDAFMRMRLMRNIVGARDARLDVRSCMNEGMILLARLSKGQIGEENAHLLGSLLLAKMSEQAHMRQAVKPHERRPFFAYVDECQNFVSPSLESLATEGRKYRIGLTLAHQTMAQLSSVPSLESALLANSHTRIAFRVGDEDAKKVSQGFQHFDADDLRALGRGEAIARIGSSGNDFNLRTRALSPLSDSAEERVEVIRAASRAKYATTPPTVEPYAPSEPEQVVPQRSEAPAPAPEPSASPIPTRPPPPIPSSPGRGGQMHKYLQHLVKRLAEERGFRATIEAPAGTGQVDVLLERDELRVGCEVSVTTDREHEAENLRKCMRAGFTHIVCISSEKKVRTHLTLVASTEFADRSVTIVSPEDVVTTLESFGAPRAEETIVRGYKVKVTRQALSPGDASAKRSAVAAVVARALKK